MNLTSYKGHTHILVRGNAATPARFWTVTLYTTKEYKDHTYPDIKKEIAEIKNHTSARYLIKLHNL